MFKFEIEPIQEAIAKIKEAIKELETTICAVREGRKGSLWFCADCHANTHIRQEDPKHCASCGSSRLAVLPDMKRVQDDLRDGKVVEY